MQSLVEGWTERVETQLLADGAPFDLTNYDVPPASVVMELFTRGGLAVAYRGSAGIESGEAATGVVYFDPDPADLKAAQSPYTVRWKVTDTAGKVAFFPNGAAETWVVYSESGT